jgi:Calcium binding
MQARMTPKGCKRLATRSARRLAKRRLDELVEEAIVDAYGESEQRVGLLSMIQMNLECPFMTEILGMQARVERVGFNDANEIVAVCRRGRERQTIPILDLRLPSPSPVGWEWIEAYRHWARGGH